VHDSVDLERRSTPTVFVASTEFVDAADAQAKALGVEPSVVYVAHPIQDRTDDEMRALADDAFDQLLAALTRPVG
jgi:hypothetical protein